MNDPYAVRGIDGAATPDEVRIAYRVLAQRFHPDHNPNNMAAVKRMQEINEAFAVLNSPERRREYDRQRASPAPPRQGPVDPRAEGRGPRPYYRGQNWGMHAGADAPPSHIVRATPTGFNLVVTAPGECPARAITIYNDAPCAVRMRVLCSPWLAASTEDFTAGPNSSASLTVAIRSEASRDLRGWRDGGVSLVTDDPRVYCPDVRITAIFMQHNAAAGRAQPRPEPAGGAREPDLRSVDASTDRRLGWRHRLFGGRT